MNNENLKKLYNTLITPSESTQNRALFDKSQIGANPEEFAKILSNADNAKTLYDALLTPKKEFGDKSLFDKSQIGSSVEDFSNIFGVQKKNPIVTEFTSGFAPSQPIKQGTSPFLKPTNNVTINPFEPKNEKWKTISLPKDGQPSDIDAAKNTGLYTFGSGVAAIPRYAYDITNAINEISKKAFGSSAESLPSYDKLRELTRVENGINILDQLDVISKRYASEAGSYAEKISTNKKGYIQAISDKDFGFLIDKTVNDLLVSAPSMLAISINPTMAATVFSSSKNLELVDSTTIPDELKPINAFFNGLAEVILEGRIGGTAVFKNTIAKMLKDGQKEAAGKFIEKTVNESIKKWAKKSYGASKELSLAALEEMGTDFTQQVTSYLTGETDKINLNQTLDAGAGGLSMAGGMKGAGKAIGGVYQYGVKPVTMKAKEMIVNNTKKKEAIINDIDNPNVSVEDKSILIDELSNENEKEANIVDNELKAIDNLDDESRARLDFLSGELTNLVSTSMDPNISEDTRIMLTDRLTNIQKEIDGIIGEVDDVETEADDINDLKDITEIPEEEIILPPIAEKAGESVTVNIGGKAITGLVYVDEGGKSTIETGGRIYELAPDIEYVDYASPIRLADDAEGLEFNGNTYQDVSFETFDGVERAILVDDNNNVKTITDPKLLEEIQYQSVLSDNDILSDDDVEQLTKIYDTRKQTETAPTSEEDGVAVPQGTEQNDKIQEALDEIDLIEQIALLYINETENAAKLVEAKVGNKNKVYLVSKNQDGSYSATLDGKKVRKGDFLNKLGADFDEQTKQQSKDLVPKLQKQVNKHKKDVERKLFKSIKKPKNATKISKEPIAQVGEQGGIVQREGIENGQPQEGQREGGTRETTQPKADNRNRPVSSKKKQEVVEVAEKVAEPIVEKVAEPIAEVVAEPAIEVEQYIPITEKQVSHEKFTRDNAVDVEYDYKTGENDREYEYISKISVELFNDETGDSIGNLVKIIDDEGNVSWNAEDALNGNELSLDGFDTKAEAQKSLVDEWNKIQKKEFDREAKREAKRQAKVAEKEAAKKVKLAEREAAKKIALEEKKVEETKPALKGLTETEKKYKEDPNSLTKDELKDVLKTKQDRLKKANLALEKNSALEKSELTAEEIKAKNNGIAVLEKSEEDLIKRINSGVTQKNAKQEDAFNKVSSSLKSSGIKVKLIEDPNEFDKEVSKRNGQKNAEGIFLSDDGVILLNKSKLTEKWGSTIIWHEGIHPIINIIRNTNPALYKSIINGLKETAKSNNSIQSVLDWANRNYKGQETISDESIVETIARIKDGKIKLESLPKTLKQSLIDFINKISSMLGFGKVLSDTDYENFKNIVSKISDVLEQGRDISSIVGSENVTKFRNQINEDINDKLQGSSIYGGTIDKNNIAQARIADIDPIDIYQDEKVEKLPVKTMQEISDKFDGKITIINSDPTRVGKLKLLSGKEIFLYGGPGYNALSKNAKNNIGFATTQLSKVETHNKLIKNVFGDENGVTLIATQTPLSLLSNSYSLRYILDAISQLPKSIRQSPKFKEEFFGEDIVALKQAFGEKGYNEFINKYKNVDLSSKESIDLMIQELGYKLSNENSPASFKARGAFNSNLIAGITEKSTKKETRGEAGYVSVANPKKFIAKALFDQFGLNTEMLFNEIGVKQIVNLYMDQGVWGLAVSGFETKAGSDVKSIQEKGVSHPLFNAKFYSSNNFSLDGVYQVDKLILPVVMERNAKGELYLDKEGNAKPYVKKASQMLAGSMYVGGFLAQASAGNRDVVTPTSGNWERSLTEQEVNNVTNGEYIKNLDKKIEEGAAHATQITTTRLTYEKWAKWLANNFPNIKDARILDIGAGFGHIHKQFDRVLGITTESYEPFYNTEKYKEHAGVDKPNYTKIDASDIPLGKFDIVVNNAVLNVIPADIRDNVVRTIGGALKSGGIAIINAMKSDYTKSQIKAIESGKSKNIKLSDSEVFTYESGKYTYQKGFTTKELVSYTQDVLGEDYVVKAAPSEITSMTTVLVQKKVAPQASAGNRDITNNKDALVVYAVMAIKLGKVKSMAQLKDALIKDLNVDFGKGTSQELRDIYNTAKETVIKAKKEPVKTTIIRTTEGRTSKEKLDVTFKDWITRLYTEVEKAAKIGAKNRSQLINDAIRYINLSNIKNLSKPKIISLVRVAANLTKYENVDQFVKYVDSVVEQADYYAKVREAENLAEALNKKVKKEKLGQITNLIKRLLMVDVNNITEQSLDDYINLMNDLTNGKVADVTALSARLAQFVGEERELLEGKILSNIISERELIAAIDTLEALNNEQQSEFLEAAIKKAKEREYEAQQSSLVNKFIRLNEAIKEYLPTKVGNKVTPAVKRIINLETYKDLIKSIKGFNRNLSRMKDMGLISENTFDLYNIDFESEEFKELNYELKEIVDKFRKSLVDQIKQYKKSIQNQLNTTGIRAKLFQNMGKVEKDIYSESIEELLSLDDNILESLDAVTLDEIFNGYEQLNNGYVSPTILNAINKLKQIANYNSLKEDYKKLQKAEEASDQKVSMFQKDISSLKNSEQVFEYIKTLKPNQIATYLSGGMSDMFLKYIYKPFEKAYTEYRKVKENLLEKVTIIDDSLGSGEKGDIIRNAVGIFLIQEDLFRYKNFDKLDKSKKSLVDYIIDQYDNNAYVANEAEMDLLKKARTQVWGELGSKAELEKTKAAYFLRYPKAKLLYDEIRNSIDEKVYPLIKIAAETDGRYFEFDDNYFPVQRRGKDGIDSINSYEQYFESSKNDNVKLVANATYSRVGDPITMRQFNATKAYYALSEDAARVSKLKPFVSPFNLSIDRLAHELGKEKDVEAVKFLKASKEYMHVSMKMLFERKEYSFSRQLRAKLSALQRNTLLGQVYRLPADFLAALTKLSTSINPSDLIRHMIISQKFNKESFEKLADLTSSPIIFKTSQMKIDAQAIDKKYGEKRIDRIAGSADVRSASIAWKVLFLREFNRISGSNFDFTEFNKDPKAYYKNNKQMMDDAAFAADNFVDTKFVNQSELGKAPAQRVIFGYTVARNSELFSHINTLNSYIANDASVVATASRRLLTKGDVKGFAKDVLPIVISQYVYSITLSFFMGIASSLGYALMGAPSGDEEDKDRFGKDYFRNLYQYTTETLGFFKQQTFNADFFKNATLISLFSMMTGRYTLIAKAIGQFVVGGAAQFDVNTKQTPNEKKKAVKKWANTFEAINDKLYVSPITLNEKSYELRTDASDIIGMVPVYGYFVKEIYRETNPKNPLTIAAGFKELTSKDPQALDAIAGLTNASLFAMTYAGLASAPTISKTFKSYAKMENDKKYKDKEKPTGLGGVVSSGFGGFSGGGFSGGMSGGGFGK
jgi:2-polyprenyl-3-methyl-5-hydroxy-6-metoxy-1,4-benzoquinol methylase